MTTFAERVTNHSIPSPRQTNENAPGRAQPSVESSVDLARHAFCEAKDYVTAARALNDEAIGGDPHWRLAATNDLYEKFRDTVIDPNEQVDLKWRIKQYATDVAEACLRFVPEYDNKPTIQDVTLIAISWDNLGRHDDPDFEMLLALCIDQMKDVKHAELIGDSVIYARENNIPFKRAWNIVTQNHVHEDDEPELDPDLQIN